MKVKKDEKIKGLNRRKNNKQTNIVKCIVLFVILLRNDTCQIVWHCLGVQTCINMGYILRRTIEKKNI